MTPAAALLRNRTKLLAACDGLKPKLVGSNGDHDVYIRFRPLPDSERLAKIRKAFGAVIPSVKAYAEGVYFPLADLRGGRAERYLKRIAADLPHRAKVMVPSSLQTA